MKTGKKSQMVNKVSKNHKTINLGVAATRKRCKLGTVNSKSVGKNRINTNKRSSNRNVCGNGDDNRITGNSTSAWEID